MPRQYFLHHCIALILGANALTSCSEQSVDKFQGFAQGTSYHISYWSSKSSTQEAVKQTVEAELDRIDRLLSNYRPDSTLELFNQSTSTGYQDLGDEIIALIRIADLVNTASQGCYDLTIKPLFELWKFNTEAPVIPDQNMIDRVLPMIGMKQLEISNSSHLRKKNSNIQVDVSSIAQGYSVEKISAALENQGINNYLVEIGGELKTKGHKPGNQPWRIAIEKPLPGAQLLQKIIIMPKDSAMAIMTSGTYRHYFDEQGKRFSHILDGRTGRPVVHDTVSVTVALADPAWADAWSTALLCLGREEGLKVADANNIPALFIEYQDGQLVETRSEPLQKSTLLSIQ